MNKNATTLLIHSLQLRYKTNEGRRNEVSGPDQVIIMTHMDGLRKPFPPTHYCFRLRLVVRRTLTGPVVSIRERCNDRPV